MHRTEHSTPFWCHPVTLLTPRIPANSPTKCLMRLHLCGLWHTMPVSSLKSLRSPENVSSFHSPTVLSCLLLPRLWAPLCYIHFVHRHTHNLPFLPSPKGLVWFMPFVRVWVGLKEIMVRLLWNCGSLIGVFSRMYITFAPVHSKSHIKVLKNLPSYSVKSEVHRTELLILWWKKMTWKGDYKSIYFRNVI